VTRKAGQARATEESAHAIFAPSSAGRWWKGGCSASTVVDVSALREPAKPAADHGTMLHAVAEKMLRENGPAPDALTPPDRRSVQAYVDYVRGRTGRKLYEFTSELVPGLCGGTADTLILEDDLLEVVDYKSGSRFVDPRENPQEIIYAAGAIKKLRALGYAFKRVKLTIVQPALESLLSWETTVEDLEDRALEAVGVVETVLDGRVEFNATDDNCKFCRAVSICPEYDKFRSAAARDDFREFGVPELEAQPSWGDRLRLIPFLEKWIKAVKDQTKDMALTGDPPDGFKVVEGRKGNRSWTEKGKRKAVDFLTALGLKETDLFGEAPMVSPAQAEELLKDAVPDKKDRAEKKEVLGGFWEEGKPGAPTLVPEDDSRVAIDKTELARRDFKQYLTREDDAEE
jgi:hypothetical protein